MILIVTYDLKTRRDYTAFYGALQQQGSWWHYIASTWLLSTDKSPEEVARALRPYMDLYDSLLVAELGGRYNGYLPDEAWQWINNHAKTSREETAERMRVLMEAAKRGGLGSSSSVPGKPGAYNPQSSLESNAWFPIKKK